MELKCPFLCHTSAEIQSRGLILRDSYCFTIFANKQKVLNDFISCCPVLHNQMSLELLLFASRRKAYRTISSEANSLLSIHRYMASATLNLMDDGVQVFIHNQLSPTIPYQYEFA